MTPGNNPLESTQQNVIDVLCTRFQQNPTADLNVIADLVADAATYLQNAALEALLERWFARRLERGEPLGVRAVAAHFGLPENSPIVIEAKNAAEAEAKQAALAKSSWNSRFLFKQHLGRGGYGRVGLYEDKHLRRDVAIKLPRSPQDTRFTSAVMDEVRTTCKVNSSRVIQIYDVGMLWDDNNFLCDDPADPHFHAERPAIIMQYAERGRLADALNGQALHIDNIERHFPKMAAGVKDIHDAGLVHIDLKPGNILFGSDQEPRIADFGLARAWLQAAPERLGGTRLWMSPELLRANLLGTPIPPDRTFDMWSLGVIFYEMLTGKHPFRMHASWQTAIQTATVVSVGDANGHVSRHWDQFVKRCLHEQPEKRFLNVQELIDAFFETLEHVTGRRNVRAGVVGTSDAGHDGHAGHHGKGGAGGSSDKGLPADNAPDSVPESSGSSRFGSGFDRRAAELFVGREELLGWMDGIFGELDSSGPAIERDGPALVAYLHAMPGSGKTYLIDRWLCLRQQRAKVARQRDGSFFVVDLPLDRTRKYSDESLRDELAAKLNLNSRDIDAALTATLSSGFLRIENVDSAEFAHAVAGLAAKLDGCRLIVSGRWYAKGAVPNRWRERAVGLLTPGQAENQFLAEVGEHFWSELSTEQQTALVTRTGRLPLAIHLTAAFLLKGMPVERLLERLSQLTLQDTDDPRFGQSVLKVMVDDMLKSLEQTLRAQPWLPADELLLGFRQLGFVHPAGVGRSLGSAISGLPVADLGELLNEAAMLHLIESDEGSEHFRLHPLIAEQLTLGIDRTRINISVADWFCERLPEPEDSASQNTGWQEISAEASSLVSWLESIIEDKDELERVVVVGANYARTNGPFVQWVRLGLRALECTESLETVSVILACVGRCAFLTGDIVTAQRCADRKLSIDLQRRDDLGASVARDLIIDILVLRGQIEEAEAILVDVQLPFFKAYGREVFESLSSNDLADILDSAGALQLADHVRKGSSEVNFEWCGLDKHYAASLGKLAHILRKRGFVEKALNIYRNEELYIYQQLNDSALIASTFGSIADVLKLRGELDEALRIRREEELPVYERLGDIHSRAITMGKIADVLELRGELDEALRIRREEQLPVYERLGDVRSKAITMGSIAYVLELRGELDEALRIHREEVLPVYERLGDVRSKAITMGSIADVLKLRGELDEALRIRREEQLPVYERLGDVRSKAITMGSIADVLKLRGELDEALRIRREEQLPVYERLGDVRSKALTMGNIADVLELRGELDEALRIRREEELPVYERLGATRDLLICRWEIATCLRKRNTPGDRGEAAELLRLAYSAAEKMQLPEANEIREMQRQENLEL